MNSLQQFRYFDKNGNGKIDDAERESFRKDMRKAKPELSVLGSESAASTDPSPSNLAAEGSALAKSKDSKRITRETTDEEKLRDKELSLLAKKGDKDAFKELVLLYEKRLLSLAFSLNRNEDDAREIVQESLLKAWKNIANFKAESSFFTWVYRIVSNMSIDFSRKRYRQRESAVGEPEILDASLQNTIGTPYETKLPMGSVTTPEVYLERVELAGNIKRAIESLTPEHQQIIILREVEGLSYAEISSSLGCSKGTVMSRLFHAREKVKKFFQDLSSN